MWTACDLGGLRQQKQPATGSQRVPASPWPSLRKVACLQGDRRGCPQALGRLSGLVDPQLQPTRNRTLWVPWSTGSPRPSPASAAPPQLLLTHTTRTGCRHRTLFSLIETHCAVRVQVEQRFISLPVLRYTQFFFLIPPSLPIVIIWRGTTTTPPPPVLRLTSHVVLSCSHLDEQYIQPPPPRLWLAHCLLPVIDRPVPSFTHYAPRHQHHCSHLGLLLSTHHSYNHHPDPR